MMAVDATLTMAERNGVFRWLNERKINPGDFDWTNIEQPEQTRRGHDEFFKVSVLTHRRTGFFFIFGGIYVIFTPSNDRKPAVQEHLSDWKVRHEYFHIWLNRLEYEFDIPDLWATIGQERSLQLAATSTTLDNRPFSAAERSLVVTKLDEIKGYLLQGQQFAADHAETIEQEFAYLRESSERLGRKDWLNNLLGGLVGLAIGLALDPEKAGGLLRLAGAVFQSLWGTGHQLLP